MNKSNVGFLALLLSLTNCTPALGAMKKGDMPKKSSVASTIMKPISSSKSIGKIDTFGTPELDLEAFILMLNNLSCETNDDDSIGFYCSLARGGTFVISRNPWETRSSDFDYKLEWKLPLEVKGDFRHLNDTTLEFDVTHENNEKTYTIVGKGLVDSYGNVHFWVFYVKGQDSVINKGFMRISNERIKDFGDVGRIRDKIARISTLSILRLLVRGANMREAERILKCGYYLRVFNWFHRIPSRLILGTELEHGNFVVQLLDENNFEYVYTQLDRTSDRFWDFELVQIIEPDKKVRLW